ncbi:MAG TPA: DUF6790 family protein [Hyphomicrobium sp.]|jgi:hypothetical protein|nr:DUF6790 family protein [Hyphomicrobium sp.]
MESVIAFVLGNFTLTFLVLGFLAALVAIAVKPGGFNFANVAEELLAYFILFSVAVSFFYNFIFHVFFGALAASFIGWADSPFQAEVGYASLGFAAIGLLAFKGNCCVRFAAILGPAMFQWGAAVGHIHDIMTTGNMAPGNAGIMLYSDIFLPIIGFALLWLKRRAGRSA